MNTNICRCGWQRKQTGPTTKVQQKRLFWNEYKNRTPNSINRVEEIYCFARIALIVIFWRGGFTGRRTRHGRVIRIHKRREVTGKV